MDIREHLDGLLANLVGSGRKPERFIVREEDWRELVERYDLAADTEAADHPQYRDVPVEFGQVSDRMIVALYDTVGDALLQEG